MFHTKYICLKLVNKTLFAHFEYIQWLWNTCQCFQCLFAKLVATTLILTKMCCKYPNPTHMMFFNMFSQITGHFPSSAVNIPYEQNIDGILSCIIGTKMSLWHKCLSSMPVRTVLYPCSTLLIILAWQFYSIVLFCIVAMGDFENNKSQDKAVLNNATINEDRK